jgi:hypothetical protein
MNVIYLSPDMVPSHLKGRYNGKKFKAEITTQVTIPSDAGLWSGGSRDTYQAVALTSGRSVAASDNMSSPWNENRKERTITLVPGLVVVRSTMFCGKDMGLTFYVHPDNATALLPAPTAELTGYEQLVLNATCSLKSSYNGRDRYQMATEYMQGERPTRMQWDDAKTSLINKGLLDKRGAVTVAGRNARKN